MTNQLALTLGVLIALAVAIDVTLYGDVHLLFLGRKLFHLIEWLQFWR